MSRVARGWDLVATLLIALFAVDGIVVLARLDRHSGLMVGVERALSSAGGSLWVLLSLEQVSLREHGRVNTWGIDDPWEGVCRLSGDEGVSREGLHRWMCNELGSRMDDSMR